MKKIIYFAFAVAALAACSKQEVNTSETSKAFRIEIVTDTKPTFNEDDYTVSWKDNDQLRVLVNDTPYTFTKVAGVDNAFECAAFVPEDGVTYNYEILNPYRSDYGEGVFTYSGGVKLTMYGQGTAVGAETPLIHMEHLTAIIKTVINNTGDYELTFSAINIESDTDNIGGRYQISKGVLTEVNPVKYTFMDNQSVKVPAGESKTMFVQCAPFTTTTDSKLTITLTAGSDIFTKEIVFSAGNEKSFRAGKVKTTEMNVAKVVEPVDDTEANKVYIDFGSNSLTNDNMWNNITSPAVGEAIALNNGKWESSSLSLTVTKAFEKYDGVSGESGIITKGNYEYPLSVWKDGFIIKTDEGAQIKISGCETDARYDIESLHVRWNGSTGPRVTKVYLNDDTTNAQTVDTGMKDDNKADATTHHIVWNNVAPDNNGDIIINVFPVLGSNNTTKEGHINAMVITKKTE